MSSPLYSFPSERKLYNCIKNHPLISEANSYLTEKKITRAVAEHFANRKNLSSRVIDAGTTRVISSTDFGRSPNLPTPLLAVIQMCFA